MAGKQRLFFLLLHGKLFLLGLSSISIVLNLFLSAFTPQGFILAQSSLNFWMILREERLLEGRQSSSGTQNMFITCLKLFTLDNIPSYKTNFLHEMKDFYQFRLIVMLCDGLLIDYRMTLNLEKMMTSQSSYQKLIKQALQTIRKDKDVQSVLKKIILFCKSSFSVSQAQRKKFLCLTLIRDISQNIKLPQFDRLLDDNIPPKLLKTIMNERASQGKSRNIQEDEQQFSEKMLKFAIQTVSFWTKKLSFLPGKSQFAEAYQQLKKAKVDFPKNYEFYRMEKLSLALWGDRQQNSQQYVRNEETSPLIGQLFEKFSECKALIQQRINEAVVNQEEIYLKPITQKLRDFLLAFFGKYKSLQAETSLDRDVLVVYFHIANLLFKRLSNRFYVPLQEMISLTKEIFEGDHITEFSSVDRMDIINLAGIHKYNALSVFQRIHNRIQQQEQKLGPCELTFEQKDVLVYANEKAVPPREDRRPVKQQQRRPKFKR